MKTNIEAAAAAVRKALSVIGEHAGTSGARALAAVLLHAYNHTEQSIDITDLCVLDDALEDVAWSILKARVDGYEPHELIGVNEQKAWDKMVNDYWITPDSEEK